jgi:flagella basal body P-ring formation protein FlgA
MMRNRTRLKRAASAALILLAAGAVQREASALSAGRLEIYLPREVAVTQEIIPLASVAVMTGSEELCQKAQTVRLGQFALPGQTIRLDRTTILSRLAAVGIDTGRVSLSGAETVSVRREGQGVAGQTLVETARAFLEEQLKAQGLSEARPLRTPARTLHTGEGRVEVVPTLDEQTFPGRRTVNLSIRNDGRETDRIEIPFQVSFRTMRPTAAVDIPAGAELEAGTVRMEEVQSPDPRTFDAAELIGKVTQREIAAGTAIEPRWLKDKLLPVVIQRRQKVLLRIERGPLLVTASGEAMDEGRVGDVIRVKRGLRPDERIVVGRIRSDGSVEPIL